MIRTAPPTGTPEALAAIDFTGSTWDQPTHLARGQITLAERMPTAHLIPERPAVSWEAGETLDLSGITLTDPLTGRPMAAERLIDQRLLMDGLLVVRDGRVLHESYRNGMTDTDAHIVQSCSKTLTTMMVGIAIHEGRLDPAAPMSDLVEELAALPAWAGVTLQNVLDMATGLDTEEHYENADSMYWRYADAVGYYDVPAAKQVGALAYVLDELDTRVEAPGTLTNYASYLTNLLPIALERSYGIPAVELYDRHLYQRIGAEHPAQINLDATGSPIVEGHVNLTLRDFARWAFPFLNEGVSLTGEKVIPRDWIAETVSPSPARAEAFARSEFAQAFPGAQYHNQAWILDPAEGVMAMLGIHGQFARLDTQRGIGIIGLGSFPAQTHPLLVASWNELWSAIDREVS